MNPLAWLLDWRVLGCIAIVAGALWLRHSGAESERQKHAAEAAEANQRERAEEQRRSTEQEKAREQTRLELIEAQRDGARAADAVRRLRIELAARGDGKDRPPAAGSATTATVGDLLGECAERYRGMAAEADIARAAGQLCERYYDALTPRAAVRANLKLNLKGLTP